MPFCSWNLPFCMPFVYDFLELEPPLLHAVCCISELEFSFSHAICSNFGAGTLHIARQLQHLLAGTFDFA